jgi:hypothetical protein
MSWTVPSVHLRREFLALAARVAGWSEAEGQQRMGTIFRQADAAVAGRKSEWMGRHVDPRYRMKATTIIDWLGITEAEMRTANLRVLVDKTIANERARERQHARRREAGAMLRVDYEAAAAERRDEVARLRASGMSWRAVALAMGLGSPDAARMLASRAPSNSQPNRSIPVYGGVACVSVLADGSSPPAPPLNIIPTPFGPSHEISFQGVPVVTP